MLNHREFAEGLVRTLNRPDTPNGQRLADAVAMYTGATEGEAVDLVRSMDLDPSTPVMTALQSVQFIPRGQHFRDIAGRLYVRLGVVQEKSRLAELMHDHQATWIPVARIDPMDPECGGLELMLASDLAWPADNWRNPITGDHRPGN